MPPVFLLFTTPAMNTMHHPAGTLLSLAVVTILLPFLPPALAVGGMGAPKTDIAIATPTNLSLW
jgi:hypothetical protein